MRRKLFGRGDDFARGVERGVLNCPTDALDGLPAARGGPASTGQPFHDGRRSLDAGEA
jgi:hypothetical protein